MNYKAEFARQEAEMLRMSKQLTNLTKAVEQAQEAILHIDKMIREAGLPPDDDLPSEP